MNPFDNNVTKDFGKNNEQLAMRCLAQSAVKRPHTNTDNKRTTNNMQMHWFDSVCQTQDYVVASPLNKSVKFVIFIIFYLQ